MRRPLFTSFTSLFISIFHPSAFFAFFFLMSSSIARISQYFNDEYPTVQLTPKATVGRCCSIHRSSINYSRPPPIKIGSDVGDAGDVQSSRWVLHNSFSFANSREELGVDFYLTLKRRCQLATPPTRPWLQARGNIFNKNSSIPSIWQPSIPMDRSKTQ